MRELTASEIDSVGGGAASTAQMNLDLYLGALIAPWAAPPVVSVTPVLGVSVALQLPAAPQGIDNRTGGS
jgi:hypothetical protein